MEKKTISKKRRQLSDEEMQAKIINRISRIEGQLKGVKRMIEGEKNCLAVITQITAIKSAISMLGMELLKNDFVCKRRDNKSIDEAYLKTLFKIS